MGDECPVPDCRSGWVPFNGGSVPCKSCTPDPSSTDLPDVETAWPTWYHENIERLWELEGRERDEALFTAGFAAASGPWAEQLDAAKAEPTSDCTCGHPRWDHFRSTGQCAESGCGCFPFTPVMVPSPLQRQLDATLARNAELEAENIARKDQHASDMERLEVALTELDNPAGNTRAEDRSDPCP